MDQEVPAPRVLLGSAPTYPKGATGTQPLPDNQIIEIAFHLNENPNINPYLAKLASTQVSQRVFLSDDNFDPTKTSGGNYFGADPSDVAAVENYVAKVNQQDPTQQLTITRREYDMHSVKVQGTVKQICALFNVDLAEWLQDSQSIGIAHTRDATVPAELVNSVRGIIGLNTLGRFSPQYVPGPPIKKESEFRKRIASTKVVRAASQFADQVDDQVRKLVRADPKFVVKPLYADEIAARQNVPSIPNQVYVPRIAILEYGGRTSQANLSKMALGRGVDPSLITNLDDGKHRFYAGGISQDNNTSDANGECDLDAQVIMVGLASKGIKHDLLEVNALDTEMGAGDSVALAARDVGHPLGGAGADLVSESWGDAKAKWTPQAISYRRTANKFALLKGVNVFVATGDNGSKDNTPAITVDYYSGDDLNVAAGGLTVGRDIHGNPMSRVWSGTGGGVDTDVPAPYYQTAAGISPVSALTGKVGRGIPDIAADADPNSGCIVLTGDNPATGAQASEQAIGGTSEATPILTSHFAAAIAQTGKRLGPLHGLINGMYRDDQSKSQTARIFRDITIGSNGDYQAQVGWDACTGVGEIADVARMAAAIMTVQPITPVPPQFTYSDSPPAASAPQLGLN